MSYYLGGLGGFSAVGGCCSNEQMEYYGRTGTGPTGGSADIVAFGKALQDPLKKKIFDNARAAAVKIQEARGQVAVAQEQAAAAANVAAATPGTILGMSKMSALLVGGGLAALAAVLVLKKKKTS